ncbi:MAG: S-methylmethionine-dependent homocysteine/selenocysteine methylase [Verrucomicrobiales bacterium]|jgi:S-methylmethionine-dependent homocysteine/selenocysteine methylase
MQKEMIVLDGGMGKHLERSGAPFRQPEWSALALLEDPDAVRRAHTDFINAGADVIITNTYSVVPFHLGADRFAERGRELATLAGRLAREAAEIADRKVLVAGSLPPLFASYKPAKFRPDDAPAMYDVLVEAQAPFVDLWIGETVSLIAEAEAILDAIGRAGSEAEVWMSFTVPDDPPGSEVGLRSGESIADAVAAVGERVSAILFNCSPPEAITVALGHVHEALADNPSGVRVGAYANAFAPKMPDHSANETLLGRREDLTPSIYREVSAGWIADGASIIGGCCQMFPEHIEALGTLRIVD